MTTKCNVGRHSNKPNQWNSMLIHQGWFNLLIYATFTPTTNYRVCNLHIYLYPTPRRHITSPSEKSRPETWPGKHMGKATPVWQLTFSHRCHQIMKCNVGHQANKLRQWKSMLTHQGRFNLLIYAIFTRNTNYRVCNLHIYLYPCSAPSHYFPLQEVSSRDLAWETHG